MNDWNMHLNSCPKCKIGALGRDTDMYGTRVYCVNCGWQYDQQKGDTELVPHGARGIVQQAAGIPYKSYHYEAEDQKVRVGNKNTVTCPKCGGPMDKKASQCQKCYLSKPPAFNPTDGIKRRDKL